MRACFLVDIRAHAWNSLSESIHSAHDITIVSHVVIMFLLFTSAFSRARLPVNIQLDKYVDICSDASGLDFVKSAGLCSPCSKTKALLWHIALHCVVD